MTTKVRIKKFAEKVVYKKSTVAIIVTLLVLAGVSAGIYVQGANEVKSQKEAALTQLAEEQKAKADELARQNDLHSESHPDTSDLQFKDITDTKFKRPTCERLEGRPGVIINNSSCTYRLQARGELTMAVIFVYERQSKIHQLNDVEADNKKSLAYMNTYLRKQAQRYDVSNPPQINMTSYGPFKLNKSVSRYYYREDGFKILEVFNKVSETNKVPEDQYDMVHFVLLDYRYGGVAFPSLHRAFTFNSSTVPTFTHETLHLLGARDKYHNNDCSTIGTNDPFGRYDGKLPGHDIMCSNFSLSASKINDITAREIGWAN